MQTGLELFLDQGCPVSFRHAGLITNPTGVDRRLRSTIDLLHERGLLAALFGPEHGVRGTAQAGAPVAAAHDARTGLPVHSLYGPVRSPTPGQLARLDALVVDLQEIGVRYATYSSTLAYAQAATAEAGLPLIVFDRPNPLGGVAIEGNQLRPAFRSFVGVHPLPVRHGLTIGELARLFAAENGWPAPIVVPMHGWQRDQWYDQTGLPWVQPSPNLPTLDSLALYSGTCLLEGTNVSEGRGTTRPFELIGAPWIDPFRLADDLNARGLPGVLCRPAAFVPTFAKHAGTMCHGVQVHILNRAALRPVALGIHILHALRMIDQAAFAWRRGPERPLFIDLLLGDDRPRLALDAGADPAEVLAGWDAEADAFATRRAPFLLYN